MLKNKRGSHVGVILSFVIFVTFLVFLFSIFGSPIKIPTNKDTLINYIEVEILNRFSSKLTILTISPDSSVAKDCIEIANEGLGFENLNSLVKDKDERLIASAPNKGTILKIDWTGAEEFFKIYYSEEPLSNLEKSFGEDCYQLLSSDISSVRDTVYVNVNKISNFIFEYESNYSRLKEELNIPVNTEFSLSFTDAEGRVNQTEQKDITADIFSREIPVQYFNESADINSGFINIRVW